MQILIRKNIYDCELDSDNFVYKQKYFVLHSCNNATCILSIIKS